ncbi:hypothetical protein MC885_004591 [Smutsia gigantea]|nr:hypothetical protein MC885_004591 [Smutsia gigantea]
MPVYNEQQQDSCGFHAWRNWQGERAIRHSEDDQIALKMHQSQPIIIYKLRIIFSLFCSFLCLQTKTGICLLQDGNQEPFKVRLHLAKDILMILEQDVICVSGEPFYSGERTVTIKRQTVGGFGLSIKGGAEHNIPVVISKISKEQRAELSGLLFIGDAILQINGINVRKCRHEEVVSFLYFSLISQFFPCANKDTLIKVVHFIH